MASTIPLIPNNAVAKRRCECFIRRPSLRRPAPSFRPDRAHVSIQLRAAPAFPDKVPVLSFPSARFLSRSRQPDHIQFWEQGLSPSPSTAPPIQRNAPCLAKSPSRICHKRRPPHWPEAEWIRE